MMYKGKSPINKKNTDRLESLSEKLLGVIKALAYTLLFFTSNLFVGAIVLGIINMNISDPALAVSEYKKYSNLVIFLSGLLTVAVVILVYFQSNGRKGEINAESFTEFLEIRPISPLICVISFFTGIFLNFFTSFVFSYLPDFWIEGYNEASSSLVSGHIIFYILGAVIMAPLAEEIIFRGLVMNRLDRCFPSVIAIAVSSLVFGVGHGQWLWAIYATALGIIFGTLYKKTGSLLTSIVMHLGFNAINIPGYVIQSCESFSEGSALYNAYSVYFNTMKLVSPVAAFVGIALLWKLSLRNRVSAEQV